ncbi:MSMEG_0570 family nitrogen starvation response protein [Pelagicoccus sp. SDUM812003]|uniref:MSMEG_0570 family nitrogen starvation response protein n=1 Tax=Pelagicoccus sp. SDUM812003 TaxID=3041267 RepID=UPI00280FBDEE|nr:MSMEG_0570 family nitrogen starvation response protein [Pelagicoccus sp. SDUM812003]MDQ8202173.1 MSMEG_0570 family nitrogen starvation response protein [Pelagicoccus sp. SDUM812003]
MPETPFSVKLPDGSVRDCYSPSSVVREYFRRDETLTVEEFVSKAKIALNEASARVEAKYGFACSGATTSLANIERWSSALERDALLKITNI